MNHNDHVHPGPEDQPLRRGEQAPELAFQPIADHGAFEPSTGPQPDPALARPGRQHTDGEQGASNPSAATIHGAKRVAALEWAGCGRGELRQLRLGSAATGPSGGAWRAFAARLACSSDEEIHGPAFAFGGTCL